MSNFGFNGRGIPFGFMQKKPSGGGGLVDGSDGDLVVLNGQTHQLTAGQIYSFNSIDVQAGGILEIVGAEAITQIGCLNAFIVNGTFRGKYSEPAVGNIILPSDNWLGLSFSHSQSQSAGGAGGGAFDGGLYDSSLGPNYQGLGGVQVNGHGGGGAGGGLTNNATGAGGNGGNGDGTGYNGINTGSLQPWPDYSTNPSVSGAVHSMRGTVGGIGGPVGPFGDGNTGNYVESWSNGGRGGGGSGGGGSAEPFKQSVLIWGYGGAAGGGRGEHGRRVFILAEQGISGSGTIDFAGNNGYDAHQSNYIPTGPGQLDVSQENAGGGGGGGAGGSGGAVWIRHFGTSTVTPTILTNGGNGGLRSRIIDFENPIGGFCNGRYNQGIGGMTDGAGGGGGITNVQSI